MQGAIAEAAPGLPAPAAFVLPCTADVEAGVKKNTDVVPWTAALKHLTKLYTSPADKPGAARAKPFHL
jgi:hypothetical protein